MKIAYLLGSLNRGGTETLLLDVFRNAQQYNLDAVGVYRKAGILEQDFIQSGVFMYKLAFQKNVISYLFSLRKLLSQNKILIVHAQQPIDALYAWLACWGTGIKIVLTFHGYDFSGSLFHRMVIRFIIQRTDINIYVSNSQKQYYQTKYDLKSEKQQFVYNGISFDKLDNFKFSSIREELGLSSDTLLLGCVGNFVPGRDQLTICRFLKKLKEQKVDFHFLFVGKRAETAPHLYDDCVIFCEQYGLSDRVTFWGSRKDVPNILSQLDGFMYASDHDTFGIAVVEAMYSGVPVFLNDWKVLTEITDNGKHAIMYRTKDEDDLLQKFTHFLENRNEYKQKAIMAKEFVINNYSIQSHIANLKEVYKTVLSK